MFTEMEPRFKEHAAKNGQIRFLTEGVCGNFGHGYTKHIAVYLALAGTAAEEDGKNHLGEFYLSVRKNDPYEMCNFVCDSSIGRGLKLFMLEMILDRAIEEADFYDASSVEITSSDTLLVDALLNKGFKVRRFEQVHISKYIYRGIKKLNKRTSVAQRI